MSIPHPNDPQGAVGGLPALPWRAVKYNRDLPGYSGNYQPVDLVDANGARIMRVGNSADSDALAHLLAAAPDLLEALQDLVQLEGGRFGTGEIKPGTYGAAVMNAARAAISKASPLSDEEG